MSVQITVEGQPPKYLTAPTYTLGRAVECDVRLPENDRLVSREHARLERDGTGMWWLVDLSTNGTFVNGERMSGRRALHDGDQMGIGRSQIAFGSVAPAPAGPTPEQPPARNAQTVFVTASELRAGIREVSARSSAPQAAPQAPASPPAEQMTEVAVASGPAPVAAPAPSLGPEAGRQLEAATPKPGPLASLEAAATPALREPLTARSPSNGAQAAPQAEAALVTPQPVPSEAVEGSVQGSAQGSVQGAERMKQCARCGHLYALEQNDCPACGDSSFRLTGAARATVLVTEPAAQPMTEPIAASDSTLAPAKTPAETPVETPAAGATPFDLMADRGEPADAAVPIALDAAASGTASGLPMASEAATQASWPPHILEGVTFGLPAEPSPNPGLSLAGLGCGLAMLLSLFLPWALSVRGGISYTQLCGAALGGASRAGGGDLALGATPGALAPEPGLLLLPALATLVVLGAAIWILSARRSRGHDSSLALVCGGTLGLIGAAMLHANLSGSGRWLFAAASVGAVVVGLSRFAALRPSQNR